MADIEKFSGYKAIDGTTHSTLKKAADYTLEFKIKAALAKFADVEEGKNEGVTQSERGSDVVFAEDMPAFLFAHKAEIMAAFNQEVVMRAPRKPKAPKVVMTPAQNAAMAADAAPLQ